MRRLQDLGLILETVEQQLNLDTPDSKIMLSLYLTIPEVENDKKSN